jgi:TonB family protein
MRRKFCQNFFAFWRVGALALTFVFPLLAQQKIAVLIPKKTSPSQTFTQKLEISLANNFKVLEDSLGEAAFSSVKYENPFNLSLREAKNLGAAIGCDYFLLLKAQSQRRYSFEKKEFYESFASVFVVSSRTGRLVFWKLASFEAGDSQNAEKKLFDSAGDLAKDISEKMKVFAKEESNKKDAENFEQMPDENSPEAKNFRPPLPYKRIRPEYTKIASLYSTQATVDIEVDIDETGKITNTEIIRWAGFGLDESVTETVRKMNWRAAERSGKTLPTRVLLRYNFKKFLDEEK